MGQVALFLLITPLQHIKEVGVSQKLEKQVQEVCLLSQLKEFGLNPKDWFVNIKGSGDAVEVIHRRDNDIKLWGNLCFENLILRFAFLELRTTHC